jgi:GntR family transcriptional repressor for pyruvate dehydrogenase complex
VPLADQTAALGESPSELMAARAAIEGVIAMQAAARITPEGLARLRSQLDAMRVDIGSGRPPTSNDRSFHVTIAEIAGNSVLARLVGELFEERHSPITSRLRVRSENAESWGTALAEHEAIYRALEARDPLGAAAAMRHHLTASGERWVGD